MRGESEMTDGKRTVCKSDLDQRGIPCRLRAAWVLCELDFHRNAGLERWRRIGHGHNWNDHARNRVAFYAGEVRKQSARDHCEYVECNFRRCAGLIWITNQERLSARRK